MIKIHVRSGLGNPEPSSSLLEKARDLRMFKTMAYRMVEDGSLIIILPYDGERVKSFEKVLEDEKFGRVPAGQAGSLKKAHYCIVEA